MTRSLLILLFLCCGALAGDGVNFAGSWDAPVNDVSAFSLDLTQTGNRITGYHTAIAHRGKRIDSVLPDEGRTSITGTITGGIAHVRFQSGYDERAVARQCSLCETTNWNGKSRSPLVFITFQCHLSCPARKNIHRNRPSEHKN